VTELKEIPKHWLDLLQHTLGAGTRYRKSQHGFRNLFCAGVGSENDRTFQEMVSQGLAKQGPLINGGDGRIYHATLAGCHAIGLHKAAIKRAFQR